MVTRKLLAFGALLSSIALYTAPAEAVVTYTYTGNNFVTITDNNPPTGAYTTSMSVSGYFTLDTALSASLPLTDVTGLAGFEFSFTDGRKTVEDSSTGLILNNFRVATDALGEIRAWIIEVGFPAALVVGAQSASIGTVNSGATQDDRGVIRQLLNVSPPSNSLQDIGRVRGNPGSWAIQQVPEPATLALFGLGLAGLGAVRRKKLAA